jgi:hypothetical protein
MTGVAAVRDRMLGWRASAAVAARRVAALDVLIKRITLSRRSRPSMLSGGGRTAQPGVISGSDHANLGPHHEKMTGTTSLRTSLQQARDAFHLPGSPAAQSGKTGRQDPSSHTDRVREIERVVARELRKALRR